MSTKVSTLDSNEYKAVDSKKSKGKVDFITKVSRFHLINKYKLFGVKKFTDSQLDQYIEYLNEEKIKYDKEKINLEAKLASEKLKYEQKVEEFASMKPKKFSQRKFNKLNFQHEIDEYAINSDISDNQEAIKENDKLLQEAKDEKSVRNFETVNIGNYSLNFNDGQKDLDDTLEEKIISETKHSINRELGDSSVQEDFEVPSFDKVDMDHVIENLDDKITKLEESKNENKNEIESNNIEDEDVKVSSELEQTMSDLNTKTLSLKENVKKSSVEVVESNIESLTSELSSIWTELVQKVLAEAEMTANKKFDEFRNKLEVENEKNINLTNELNNTKEELNKSNDKISEKDKEIEELKKSLAQKDEELKAKDDKINEMSEGSKHYTDEIDRLTAENNNFRISMRTLLQSASNAMMATMDTPEEGKIK